MIRIGEPGFAALLEILTFELLPHFHFNTGKVFRLCRTFAYLTTVRVRIGSAIMDVVGSLLWDVRRDSGDPFERIKELTGRFKKGIVRPGGSFATEPFARYFSSPSPATCSLSA